MPLADPRAVDDLLNYRLSRLLEKSGAPITRLCEGRYGITRREWRLIALLAAHGAMSPSALAGRAHLPRGLVSRLLTGLVSNGLVHRTAMRSDGQRAQMQLAPKGEQLYAELFPQSVRFSQEVLAALSAEEVAAFESAMDKLTTAAERVAAAKPVPEKADRRHGGARRLRER